MSNKRDLKKRINEELAEVIEACYDWQFEHTKEADKAEKIIDETIETFDNLIGEINKRDLENPKKHFSSIKDSLKKSKEALLSKVSKL